MNKKHALGSALCLVVLLAVLTGCGGPGEAGNAETTAGLQSTEATNGLEVTTATQTTELTENLETTVGEQATVGSDEKEVILQTEDEILDPNVVAVNTPYGRLYYQEQWAEFMKVEQVTEDGLLYAHFVTELNGANYPLFTLLIGTAEGDASAQLTDADGVQRNVYVQIEEFVNVESLSAEEQDRLYAMQEEINFVIENIQ